MHFVDALALVQLGIIDGSMKKLNFQMNSVRRLQHI